jgi:hypothetical protein
MYRPAETNFLWSALAFLLVASVALPACRKVPAGTGRYRNLSSVEMVRLECGDGQTESVEKWSRAGKARGCLKESERHGRWVFWEEGYVNLEGHYRNGAKHGPWTVFERDGSVYSRITFENGKKTEKKIY